MKKNTINANSISTIILTSIFLSLVVAEINFNIKKSWYSGTDIEIAKSSEQTERKQSDRALIMAGSGTTLPINGIIVQEFSQAHPEIKIEIPPSIGTAGAIQAVAEREIPIGLASRELLGKERQLPVKLIPYAKTPIVIGAHQSVSDENITYQELVQIYQGKKTRWNNGDEIIVLTRQPGDSINVVLEQKIPNFKEAYRESYRARRWITLFTDKEANRILAEVPKAIGVSDLGSIVTEKLPIKILNVAGIAPTPENIKNGKYGLYKTLYFVLPEQGNIAPEAKAYIDFVLSDRGKKILQANGYLPIEEQ